MSFNNTNYIKNYTHNDRGVLVPKGSIIIYPMTNNTGVPHGFLRCDGSLVSITTYPDLFAVLGYEFGGQSGTTFRLPNYESQFLYGKGNAANEMDESIGNDSHTLSTGEIPSHVHSFTSITHKHRCIISSGLLHNHSVTVPYNDDYNNSHSNPPYGFFCSGRQSITTSGANTNGYGIGHAPTNAYIAFGGDGQANPSAFSIIPKYANMVFLIKF